MNKETKLKEFDKIIRTVPRHVLHDKAEMCSMCGQPWEKSKQVLKLRNFVKDILENYISKKEVGKILEKRYKEYHKECLGSEFINGRFWEAKELEKELNL